MAVDPTTDLPDQARPILAIIAASIQALQAKITTLDREIRARAKADPVARRLIAIPGVGPVVATALVALVALVALAPPASTFRRGRNFAAWVGLTPRQNPSGGKERLGRISKMGERSLRRPKGRPHTVIGIAPATGHSPARGQCPLSGPRLRPGADPCRTFQRV
jgi:transposase